MLVRKASLAYLLIGQAKATYWINQVSGYDSLPQCAETPVSTIVRDMVYGCGDGGKATSYDCFCTESSSRFRNMIATHVAITCSDEQKQAVASATSLYNEYCRLGKRGTATSGLPDVVTTTISRPETTTPLSTGALVTAPTDANRPPFRTSVSAPGPSEPGSTAPIPPDSGTLSTATKAAIGVCVPVAVLSLTALGILLYRRRPTRHPDHTEHEMKPKAGDVDDERALCPTHSTGSQNTEKQTRAELNGERDCVELDWRNGRVELDGGHGRVELHAHSRGGELPAIVDLSKDHDSTA